MEVDFVEFRNNQENNIIKVKTGKYGEAGNKIIF